MKYRMKYLGYSHYTYWDALKLFGYAFGTLRKRLTFEIYCLFLAFKPHHRNHYLRKVLAIILVLVWGVITIAIATDIAHSTTMYGVLSAFVWSLVGRMWGIEIQEFSLTSGEKK